MNQRIKVFSVYASILLLLPFGLTARAMASRQESYAPSAEALAAAERFRSNRDGRKFPDLEVLLKEFRKDEGVAPAGARAEYRAISRQQLVDLLGLQDFEPEKDAVAYIHNYGSTSFFFENDRLKDVTTLSQVILWYAPPRQSLPKRLWYRAVRWTRKLKRLLS